MCSTVTTKETYIVQQKDYIREDEDVLEKGHLKVKMMYF